MTSIEVLRKTLKTRAHEYNLADRDLRNLCKKNAAEKYASGSSLDRAVEYLTQYADQFRAYVCEDLFIAGAGGYFRLEKTEGFCHDIGHYCANYSTVLELGVEGLRKKIEAATPTDEIGKANQVGFLKTVSLFERYILAHATAAEEKLSQVTDDAQKANLTRMASDLRYISLHKPVTFLQGLQLVWLAHCYLHVKPHTDTITFGNLDRTLGRLYEEECRQGTLDSERALELICHFYLACETMERDTQNIVLGGSDENGNYFENELTCLMLRAQTIVRLEQPSVSLKIRKDTSDAVWEAALDLLSCGIGMPAFLGDDILRQSLRQTGFSETEANTYCNVGCYEMTPYGSAFGGTVSGSVTLVNEFSAFFAKTDAYESFDALLSAWHDHLSTSYREVILPTFAAKRKRIEMLSASPFCACIMDGCIESLRLPEQYGNKHSIFSVLFGGIGTLTDSLLAIKHFVYDTKQVSLDELREQVAQNFPNEQLLSQLRAYPNKFGSYDEYSNRLAATEADFLAALVRENPFDERVKMMPALFIFKGDINTETLPATPDGRRAGDRYSYGASAAELLPHRDITKVLMSSATLPTVRFPIGAPQTVNLMADLVRTPKGREVVRRMVETYLFAGGTHIQINLADPDVLRDAQAHPEQYTDLLIRISGHTEPFIRLNKRLQDALIDRAALGC